MSKKGTGQHTVWKKSCHVNEINFLSKKFIVEVQTAHYFEAFYQAAALLSEVVVALLLHSRLGALLLHTTKIKQE